MTDFDHGPGAWAGELERVGQQVLKDLPHQNRITLHRGQISNHPFHLPPFALRLENGDHFHHDRVQLDRMPIQGMTSNSCQIQ